MTLFDQATAYVDVLQTFLQERKPLELSTLEPARTALVSVDVIEGFHRRGALASPRVEAIIPKVVNLVDAVHKAGVPSSHMAFVQDNHPQDAQEFDAYPPHCITGSDEAEAVSELKHVTGWDSFQHFTKNSIASHTSEQFVQWLEGLDVDTIIAVGDVTDLCLYTLALHLQVRNLARGLKQRIIVPENCVQTWDAPDHPGDLYHATFLHQLSRNGVEVVSEISY